ncbi:curli assembly protein CsgF [Litoribacillus peritrichatus]|uniref:Curli production assembly/transport component CsgF n=1 Tax=Litoribacillus peritrichatus TaxID=718191 RepID=A0ABP7NDK3_9GAMM
MKRKALSRSLQLLTGLFVTVSGYGGELVYQPVNPSFGGNPLNGSYLLNSAQAQNSYKDPDAAGSAFSQRSALDRFTDSLESRLLNQLLTDVGSGNEGTLITDDFVVDIIDDSGNLFVRVEDRETGETTEIQVNGLNPTNP